MPREVLYPVMILQQKNNNLLLHCNGRDAGYHNLLYWQEGCDIPHVYTLKDSNEITLSYFPEGAGVYYFAMTEGDDRTSALKTYVTCDSNADVFRKIISYIVQPADQDYMNSVSEQISKITHGYTRDLLGAFKAVKDMQEYERLSFYQLIMMAERYENVLALTFNRSNAKGTTCHYDAAFHVTPAHHFTSVELYSVEGGIEKYCGTTKLDGGEYRPTLSPNTFYHMDFYCESELLLRLVHYQFDEQGTAYIWNLQKSTDLDDVLEIGAQFSQVAIDLTDEDKKRILEERTAQPKDCFIERVDVVPDILDPKILHIIIPEYSLMALSSNSYYLSIVERDLLGDRVFDHRYKIDHDTIIVNTRQELIDDEILLCIKDESGEQLSKFTRYDMRTDMSEYAMSQRLVELYEYNRTLLESFQKSFDSRVYEDFSVISNNLSHDSDMTLQGFKNALITQVGYSQRLRAYRDNIIFFIEDDWMRRFNYDSNFFTIIPKFYAAEERILFPRLSKTYWVIAECHDVVNQKSYKRYYYVGGKDSGISVPVFDEDLQTIYAINEATHRRSGFFTFNNMSEKTYHYDAIDVEVDIYDG